MEKIKIGVIFGGRSGEHEVSIRSAQTVIEQIDREKFEVVPVAITKKGQWLNPSESLTLLPESVRGSFDQTSESFCSGAKIALLGDTEYKGLARLESSEAEKNFAALDVVFPVLHGTFGEDGTIQGLFEMANIPYVGCGVLASSCGMDKVVMKTLFANAELPICEYVWFLRNEWERESEAVIDRIKAKLGFPCFVKPANLGSSVGVSKASDKESLQKAIKHAAEYDRKIIVEEGLDAREIECAVIGNDEAKASLPGEYIILDESKKFLDYTEKYTGTGNNEFVVPARISTELSEQIQQMAVKSFRAIDGAGLARVDFFLRNDTGALLINEINTMPGMTQTSGFPKMWKKTGTEFSKVIEILVEAAFERHKDKARNKTIK